MRVEPRLRVLHDFHPPALHSSPARLGFTLRGKIVVELEPAIETGGERLAVQNDGTDKCRVPIASLLERLGQRKM